MRYWQEQAWARFTAAHPEFAVAADELAAALRVCHLHGDELRPDTAEVFHGNLDLERSYVEVRARLFPNAAQDVVSTEGQPFEGDRIGVLFCPSCRISRADWDARRRAKAERVRGYKQRYAALSAEFDQALDRAKNQAASDAATKSCNKFGQRLR
jgi:hypothetical protein